MDCRSFVIMRVPLLDLARNKRGKAVFTDETHGMGKSMIDAEKLLGKVLAGAMQGNVGKKTKRKKKKKKRKSDDLVGGLLRGLTSGKGMVAALGLGIGAYEIYKHQTTKSTVPPRQPAIPSPPAQGGVSTIPPPIPGQTAAPAPSAPPPPTAMKTPINADTPPQHLATLLIQTMVAAAYADGLIDQEEENKILEQLQEQNLSLEEKQFLMSQLHSPKSIDDLVADITDPVIAQTIYSVAVSTIVIDTPAERQWLDQLANALNISENLKRFIEEEL